MSIDFRAALELAGALQRVTTPRELVEVTRDAVVAKTRYRHAWLALFEEHDPTHARLVEFAGDGPIAELAFSTCPLMPIAGDPMMEAIRFGGEPVVVDDARIDPRTNKDFVAKIGNRTIINVPLVLGDRLLGSLGVGTFDDEGVQAPSPPELEWLTVVGMQLAAAYSRLMVLDGRHALEQSQVKLERHLESLQRVELMGILASGVAHDLNNHLTVIQSGLDLIVQGHRDLVEDVRLAAERAREVTHQLLTLGRASAPRREEIDLRTRLARTVKLLRPSMPRGVQVLLEEGSATIEGDPVQIDQVLANLLINARDAVGSSGTIRIGVDERELDPTLPSPPLPASQAIAKGRYGHLWVSDDGCGIAPENLDRIFDPLFSTKSKGTGLGLAVVSRVVQQHAGLVLCDSTPGRGTTFEVYLPVAPT
jgi:signal transduction histidine kinase